MVVMWQRWRGVNTYAQAVPLYSPLLMFCDGNRGFSLELDISMPNWFRNAL